MNSELRRIRRVRLLAGIVAGIIVGTVHALVSHVMARDELAATSVQQSGWFATDTDAAAR